MKQYTFILFLFFILGCNSEQKVEEIVLQDIDHDRLSVETFEEATSIQWMDWEGMIVAQQKEERLVFVDLYTDWCGWCKKMDAGVFSDPLIAGYINSTYYPVKYNAESQEELDIMGRLYKSRSVGNRIYNEWSLELLEDDLTFPAVLILEPNLETAINMRGFQTAISLEPTLAFFGEGYYNEMKWKEFRESYQSFLDH